MPAYFWLFKIALTLVFFISLLIFFNRFLTFIGNRSARLGKFWGKEIPYIFYGPAAALLAIFSLSYIGNVLAGQFDLPYLRDHLPLFRSLTIVVTIFWFLLRCNKILLHRKGGKLTDTISFDLISKVISLSLFFVAALVILQIIGLDVIPLLTFGGIGAAVLGFSGKDVFANFFGGVMLYAARPFIKGELVELPAHKILGTIEEMGWYMTCMRDLYKKPMYIPNALFSSGPIINFSRMSHRRIEEKLQLAFQDLSKILVVTNEIQTLIKEDPGIDSSQDIFVYFTAFSSYSLELYIRAFTMSTTEKEFFQIRQNLLLRIAEILEDHECEIPFPITTVHLEK